VSEENDTTIMKKQMVRQVFNSSSSSSSTMIKASTASHSPPNSNNRNLLTHSLDDLYSTDLAQGSCSSGPNNSMILCGQLLDNDTMVHRPSTTTINNAIARSSGTSKGKHKCVSEEADNPLTDINKSVSITRKYKKVQLSIARGTTRKST